MSTKYCVGDLSSNDLCEGYLESLAWLGDAEVHLFVRRAMLARGIKDQSYFDRLTSRKAQCAMLSILSGSTWSVRRGSEYYEALYVTDVKFRIAAEMMLLELLESSKDGFGNYVHGINRRPTCTSHSMKWGMTVDPAEPSPDGVREWLRANFHSLVDYIGGALLAWLW